MKNIRFLTKQIATIALTCFFTTILNAQDEVCDTIFLDNGSSVTGSQGISAVTSDLDGHQYSTQDGQPSGVTGSYHVTYDSIAPNDSNAFYYAISWFSPADTASNWLYYSNIYLPENGGTLTWNHRFPLSTWRDQYLVYVSSADTNAIVHFHSFNDSTSEGDTTNWGSRSADLNLFAGDSISVFFIHNQYDGFVLHLDEIMLTSCQTVVDTTPNDTVITNPVDTTTGGSDTTSTGTSDTTISNGSDTTYSSGSDTTMMSDTIVITNNDTIWIRDSIEVNIYDTIVINNNDTIEINNNDTITITDTIVINNSETENIIIDLTGSCNDITTGLEEGVFENDITTEVYPNPVSDQLNITVNNSSNVSTLKLNLYNSLGQIVTSINFFGSTSMSINFGALDAGMYYIEIIGDNAVLAQQAVMKQ